MGNDLFKRLGQQAAVSPEKEQREFGSIPRGPLLQPIVPPTDYNSPPLEKCLDWLVNRWPKDTIRAREIRRFGPAPLRNRKRAIATAKTLAEQGWLTPLETRQYNEQLWHVVRGPSAPGGPLNRAQNNSQNNSMTDDPVVAGVAKNWTRA